LAADLHIYTGIGRIYIHTMVLVADLHVDNGKSCGSAYRQWYWLRIYM
jgi:hypothetical protein